MLRVSMLNDPKLHTHLFVNWGSALVLPLRRALASGRQQSDSRIDLELLEIQVDDREIVRLAKMLRKNLANCIICIVSLNLR